MITEHDYGLDAERHFALDHRPIVVEFSGDGRHFVDLRGHHIAIREELIRIAHPRSRRALARIAAPIVINVRLGRDFREPGRDEDFLTKGLIRTPLEWYRSALKTVRAEIGLDAPALVVSDGSDRELEQLLREGNVTRHTSHHALDDLLALGQAKYIIGAGGSSFTAWGGFLSQANIVTITGQSLKWFGLDQATQGSVRTYSSTLGRFSP